MIQLTIPAAIYRIKFATISQPTISLIPAFKSLKTRIEISHWKKSKRFAFPSVPQLAVARNKVVSVKVDDESRRFVHPLCNISSSWRRTTNWIISMQCVSISKFSNTIFDSDTTNKNTLRVSFSSECLDSRLKKCYGSFFTVPIFIF